MSGALPGRRGRSPRTDAEWAREIQRRLSALESSTTVRIGPWVVGGTDDGHLTATAPGRRSVLTGITDLSQIDVLQRKIAALEQELATKADKLVLGRWEVSTDEQGRLVATAGERRVVLAELPDTAAP